MCPEVLGVDIGGVIIDRVDASGAMDTSFFTDDYLRTMAVPEAFETLLHVGRERFGNNIFLVSKCGSRIQEKTLHWLDHHDFYERTGVSRDHVLFCKQRSGKAGICVELGVTHFVDDRLEILGSLTSVSNLYLFRPHSKEVERYAHFLGRVKHVDYWGEILKDLCGGD